jgi:flagellar protein FlgJ
MGIEPANGYNYTDLGALGALKREAKTQDAATVREAARQFESLFTRMMLSSMRSASSGDSLFDSKESGFYRDMFDDQLAVDLSRGRGLGLADMLVEQLVRSGAIPPESGVDPAAGGAAGAAPVQGIPRASIEGQPVGNRDEFVSRYLPLAEAASQRLGVAPATLLAHAALETGWGRSSPRAADGSSSFNFFGIKAGGSWSGSTTDSRTVEFEKGIAQSRVETFRAYDSPAEGFADYARLLSNSRRYASALGTGTDAAAFAQGLQAGGYATDPRYAEKLTAVAASVQQLLDERLKGGSELPIHTTQRRG